MDNPSIIKMKSVRQKRASEGKILLYIFWSKYFLKTDTSLVFHIAFALRHSITFSFYVFTVYILSFGQTSHQTINAVLITTWFKVLCWRFVDKNFERCFNQNIRPSEIHTQLMMFRSTCAAHSANKRIQTCCVATATETSKWQKNYQQSKWIN